GDLGALPAQGLTEDEHRTLPCGQVLQRGHECQPDRLTCGCDVGRVAVEIDHLAVGYGLDEHVLAELLAEHRIGRPCGTHLHRPGAALRAAYHVDAHVVGDAVEPRA